MQKISENKMVEMYYIIDEFCTQFNRTMQQSVLLQLGYFVKTILMAECTGISFIDSTPLRVCKNQRIHIHKVFKGVAERGKCSMGVVFRIQTAPYNQRERRNPQFYDYTR